MQNEDIMMLDRNCRELEKNLLVNAKGNYIKRVQKWHMNFEGYGGCTTRATQEASEPQLRIP